ncbi:MAG TPA: oligosaccharide flippase family protein, partial [Desulfobacterales bacterium]|nr:oligosaccharide flippase family protein [Desulfobacterales bacterium]
MKELGKSTVYVGLSEAMFIIVAIVRNKYLAVTIGPEGFGLFDLLNTFFNYAVLIAGSWMSMASLKYISEYHGKGDVENIQNIFSFSITLVLIIGVILSLALLLSFNFIKNVFLVKEVLFSYYALFC